MNFSTRNGLIAGLLCGLIIFIIRQQHLTENKMLGFGIFFTVIMASIASCSQYKTLHASNTNFGKIFGAGFATTATATVITVLMALGLYLVFPNFKTEELTELRNSYINLQIPDGEIEKQINEINNHFYSIKSSQYLFPLFFSGALFTALASLALSKIKR
jgi:riboflavin transporter FmnP